MNNKTTSGEVALRVARCALLLMVFLVPTFFFSFFTNVYEFPKSGIFYILTAIAALACTINAFLKKKAEIKVQLASLTAIVFLVVVGVSTFFSNNPWASFLGETNFSGTLVTTFFLVVLLLVITSFEQEAKLILWLVSTFFLAAVVSAIFFLLAVFGPQVTPALNIVAESFSIYGAFLAVAFTLGFGLMVLSREVKSRISWLFGNLIVFAALFVLDEMIAWILLVFGLFFWLVFLSFQSKKFTAGWVVLPTLLIILSLFLSFVPTASLTGVSFVRDSTLNFSTSLEVVKNNLGESFLLGSGPEMYLLAMSSGRPISFNNSALWYLRFGKAANELLQLMSTVGFFALVCFLVIGLSLIIAGFRQIFKIKESDPRFMIAPLVLFPLATIFIASLFTSFNIVLTVIFWLFLAFGILIFKQRVFTLNLAKSATHNFVFSLCFALFLVAVVSFSFLIGRLAVSEYLAFKTNQAIGRNEDLKTVADQLKSALRLNSWRGDLRLTLAKNLAEQAELNSSSEQPDDYSINSLVQESLNGVREAQAIDRKNPLVYDQSISILTSLNNLAPNLVSNDLLATYQRAQEIDPNNPAYAYAYGDLLLSSAESLSETDGKELTSEQRQNKSLLLKQAREKLTRATELKFYYLAAELRLSRAQELLGNIDQAISRIDSLLIDLPANNDLLFESGRLHFTKNEIEPAKQRFNQILLNKPESIDARYMLALTLEQEGNFDQAITELETIQNTTPGSRVVADKLNELQGRAEKTSE